MSHLSRAVNATGRYDVLSVTENKANWAARRVAYFYATDAHKNELRAQDRDDEERRK